VKASPRRVTFQDKWRPFLQAIWHPGTAGRRACDTNRELWPVNAEKPCGVSGNVTPNIVKNFRHLVIKDHPSDGITAIAAN